MFFLKAQKNNVFRDLTKTQVYRLSTIKKIITVSQEIGHDKIDHLL